MRTLFSFLFILFLISQCNQPTPGNNLTGQLELITAERDTVDFDVADLTLFDWDEFLVIPPYSNIDTLEQAVEIDLEPIRDKGIETRDDVVVLGFVRNGKLINYYMQERAPFDFAEASTPNAISKPKAKYRIVKKGDSYIVKPLQVPGLESSGSKSSGNSSVKQ